MNLYKMNGIINEILENGFFFDEETGEVIFDESSLEELNIAFNEKVDNVACYIKSLENLNNGIKAEKKALDARIKANDKKVEWLKDYLTYNLKQRDMSKFESARNKITFRKSTSVNVLNEDLIPIEFKLAKMEYSLDKKSLKDALTKGVEIEGCELVTKNNLQLK